MHMNTLKRAAPSQIRYRQNNPTISIKVPLKLKHEIDKICQVLGTTKSLMIKNWFLDQSGMFEALTNIHDREYGRQKTTIGTLRFEINTLQDTVSEQNKAHQLQIRNMKLESDKKNAEEIQALDKKHESEIIAINEAHDTKIESLNEAHATEIESLRIDNRNVVADLETQLDNEKRAHEQLMTVAVGGVKLLRKTNDNLKSGYELEVFELNERYKELDNRYQELDKRYLTDMKKLLLETERLNRENLELRFK